MELRLKHNQKNLVSIKIKTQNEFLKGLDNFLEKYKKRKKIHNINEKFQNRYMINPSSSKDEFNNPRSKSVNLRRKVSNKNLFPGKNPLCRYQQLDNISGVIPNSRENSTFTKLGKSAYLYSGKSIRLKKEIYKLDLNELK